ncbi:MAG TPA: hypothetical protein VHX11_08960 [Acidobacteriaceae bacterium]|jgi:hypothetical protein|nr:hypothetical protein [Acidobacteriaceae bacterium]
MATAAQIDFEQELADRLAEFRWDPLGAVLFGFPWGEGDLAGFNGPRKWQCEELELLGEHLRNPETRDQVYARALSSGHGIGKTTLAAFLSWWAQSTMLDAMARVTANTDRQLTTVVQPEFSRWFRRAINAHWFNVQVSSIKADDSARESTWRLDFMPWSNENPQAFAGKHNAGRRMLYLFEEAAPIPNEIYRVARGALTDADTEKILFAISNCSVNTGTFYEAVFGNLRHRWTQRVIDSREVEGCNLEEIKGWLAECEGNEDSDYFRVRARGLFPKGAAGQFIDLDLISKAQMVPARSLPDDALVAGCDFAWGGSADNVVRFRKGMDARSIPPVRVKGEFTRDPAVMVGKLGDILTREYEIGGRRQKVDMLFCDSAGIAGPVVARLRALGHKNIMEVNFGQDSTDPKFAYRRDEIWGKLKQSLLDGLAIDKDPGLAADLAKPMLVSDPKQRVKLESKELMMKRLQKLGVESSSPDDADSLALTYAAPVLPQKPPKKAAPPYRLSTYA